MTQVALPITRWHDAPVVHRTPVEDDDTGRIGALLAGTLLVGSFLACFAGLARLVLYGFPVASLGLAVYLLVRRRWYSYLALSLVVWLSEAGLRRVVDWRTTYHPTSLILISGGLVGMAALPWALAKRRAAYRDVRAVLLITALALLFGCGVGVVKTNAVQMAADLVQLAPGLITGLFVLTVPEDDLKLRRLLRALALWGCLLLGGYAVLQFLVLPPWDADWIIQSGITSVGKPEAGHFRAFSTLTTTGPLGYVMAALLLMLVAERRGLRQGVVGIIGLLALGVTLIRGGWIGFVVGLVALLVLNKGRAVRIASVLGIVLALVVTIPSPIQTAIVDRAQKTTTSGTDDQSFRVRFQFQSQIAPQTLRDPIGDGLGSSGGATDLSGSQSSNIRIRNFDSGLFQTLFRYGSLAGLVLLGSIVWSCGRCLRRARLSDPIAAAAAAALLSMTFAILLTDTLRGVYGVVFYLLLGFLGRPRQVRVPAQVDRRATA